jgi:peptidoglycan/LPS O-acetylase OafA/YrhL
MKCLFVVALAVGAFEAMAAALPDDPDLAARLLPAAFAAVFLLGAWAMWWRRSVLAASAIGVLLVLEVAFTPFYERTSVGDWIVQLAFAAAALVGIVAWIDVLRSRSTVRSAAPR